MSIVFGDIGLRNSLGCAARVAGGGNGTGNQRSRDGGAAHVHIAAADDCAGNFAGGEVAGTVISGGNVDVSGSSITASLIASSVSTSGDASGATEGIPQSNVAKDNAQTADDASTVTSKTSDDDDDLKKKKKGIVLAQKVSRVTVILPQKN